MWNLLSLTCFTCCCLVFAESIGNCSPDSCKNGGTCIRIGLEEAEYRCYCQTGWYGEYCTLKEGNPCSSDPCQNGGICYNLYVQYLCICNTHWSGNNCQIPTKNIRPCGSWEFPCDIGGCTLARNRCDGIKNCNDGSDEEYCVTIKPQPPCRPGMYSCSDKSCIAANRRCDGYIDCINSTDEIGCSDVVVTHPSVVTTNYKIHDTFTGIELAIITGFLLFTMCILLVLFAQKRGFRITRRQQASLMYRRQLREAIDRLDVRECSHFPGNGPIANNQYMADQIIVSYNAEGDAIRFSENAWKHIFHNEPPPPYTDINNVNNENCPLPVNELSVAEGQPPSYDDTVTDRNSQSHQYHHHHHHHPHRHQHHHHAHDERTRMQNDMIGGSRQQRCNMDFETTI